MFLSIKTKIFFAIACILGLAAWLLVFLLSGQLEMVDIFNKVITDNFKAIQVAENLKHNFVLYDDYIFRYLVTDDSELFKESRNVQKKVAESLKLIKKIVKSNTEKERIIELEKELDVYYMQVQNLIKGFKTVEKKKAIMEILKQMDKGAAKKKMPKLEQEHAIALLTAEGRSRLIRIYSLCEKLVDINRARLEEAEGNISNIMSNSKESAFRIGGSVLAGILFIALVLSISIVSPLSNLLAGVKKVTEGDLELEIPVKSGDEVGRLTTSFNTMTRKLKDEHKKLLEQTITDQLTGLHNFRYFQDFFKNELSRSARHETPFSLLLIDIDYFKHYNDTNGHQMGNLVLKDASARMKESLRREDFIARYGGEEFIIVLPETPKPGAVRAAERIRLEVEHYEFPMGEKQPNKRLTISIGGTSFPRGGDFSKPVVAKQLVEEADKALYEAKKKGRNRVEWFTGK